MNTTLLRVLLVEDSEDDALLTLLELRKGGFKTEWERVDTRAGMERSLSEKPWDLVICDHVMPGFSSAGALDVMRKRSLDLPFIIVSGVAPEDLVTAAMRQGAHDFISKGNLVRLVPAVQRELKEAALRSDRRRIASRLEESEARMTLMAAAVEQVQEAIAIAGPQGTISYANGSFEALTGFSGEQVQGCGLAELLGHPDVARAVGQAAKGSSWEGRLALTMDGRASQEVDATFSPVRDSGHAVSSLVAVLRDVTKEVELERQLRQAQKMDALGVLAAGIAHDFNNVLTTILASAELIKCRIARGQPDPAQGGSDPARRAVRGRAHQADPRLQPQDRREAGASGPHRHRARQPAHPAQQHPGEHRPARGPHQRGVGGGGPGDDPPGGAEPGHQRAAGHAARRRRPGSAA